MKSTPSVDRICQAAVRVASRDGLLSMTLDNVAKEAGISKGGVMYHFPTKELLMTAMMKFFGERAERMLMSRIADDPEPRMRWARAMLGCLFPEADISSESSSPDEANTADLPPEILHQFMLATLAAAANNPGLFAPMRELGQRMRDRLLSDPEDGLDQLLVWLAVDGLFLWQFVGMIEADDPLYQRVGIALRERVSKTTSAKSRTKPRRPKSIKDRTRST